MSLNEDKYRKISILVIVSVALISAFFVYQLKNLRFDYNFESFFPQNDPDLDFYLDYRDKFEHDNDYILIGIEKESSVFDSLFLQKVNVFSNSLRNVRHVSSVISPLDLKEMVIGPFAPIEVPYIHKNPYRSLQKDSLRVYSSNHLAGSFFSSDAKAITIYLKTVKELSKVKSDSVLFGINRLLPILEVEKEAVHISGRIPGQHYIINKMQSELQLFMSISLVLIILILIATYQNLWGVIIPLVVVLLSALWLIGLMCFLGVGITILNTLLPTILFVVGMSDVIHIITRYLEELRSGKTQVQAVLTSYKEVGLATFLTSFTTAVGFVTLMTATIQPLRQFGLYTAIGVMLAYFLAITLLPAVLILNKPPKSHLREKNSENWNRFLSKLLVFIFKRRRAILISSILLFLMGGILTFGLKVNNYLMEDLRDNDPHKKDFVFFEEKFSGVRPFELAVWTKSETGIDDPKFLMELQKLEDYLIEEYKIGFVVSPLSYVKAVNKAANGGSSTFYKLPESDEDWNKIKPLLNRIKKSKDYTLYVSEDNKSTRISGKMDDIGGAEAKRRNEALLTFVTQNLDAKLIEVRVTGMSYLIDKNNEYLAQNLIYGLLIAFAVISIIIGLLYYSLPMVLIALAVNILPLLMIVVVMVLSGIDIKVSTSMIFTIAFGIAVDDTLHFLSKLKMELSKGKSLVYAVKRTFLSAGKAIILTSVVLFFGFMSLVFSTFMSTFYIGLLISLTLLFALLCDVFLLPILVLYFYRRKVF